MGLESKEGLVYINIMSREHGIKYFHLVWATLSLFVGFFIVYQIAPETIYLNPVIITSGDPVEATKTCGESCDISGQLLSINSSNFSGQLNGFDNFFPLSAISRFDLKVNYVVEGNIFLEVTYPRYSEKVRNINIFCNGESSPKYSSSKPYESLNSVRAYLVDERISQYFSCGKPSFNFSYNPTQKIEVGPNEYVKFTTQGKDVVVAFNNLSITLTPDWLTKLSIFLISFFLSLGAGSILYLYLCKLGVFREASKQQNESYQEIKTDQYSKKLYNKITMQGYITNIEKAALENDYFRKVLYTAKNSQLVVMSLRPNEDIGEEVHQLDQFIRCESGQGKAILDGVEHAISDGSAVVIPAGTRHNIINTSSDKSLKLYTIYSPPNHLEGTIHKTKADALADEEEHFDGKTTE